MGEKKEASAALANARLAGAPFGHLGVKAGGSKLLLIRAEPQRRAILERQVGGILLRPTLGSDDRQGPSESARTLRGVATDRRRNPLVPAQRAGRGGHMILDESIARVSSQLKGIAEGHPCLGHFHVMHHWTTVWIFSGILRWAALP